MAKGNRAKTNQRVCRLPAVVAVDEQACVNCHKCISVCPVKLCNDASGDHVRVNADLCIGCGRCLTACTHGARHGVDDSAKFFQDAGHNRPMVAVVAPSAASNFSEQYLRLNGWLISQGVEAVFDVSFGAELAAKSCAEHLRREIPDFAIAPPCPAIVTYLQIYQPELLPYLVPADSPIVHTIKMISQNYPEYRRHRIVAITPCFAKKREIDETGLGAHNVTFESLAWHFEDNSVDLNDYPEIPFLGPAAGEATLLPLPSGLAATMQQWIPDLAEMTRTVQGTGQVYEYLTTLPQVIRDCQQNTPLLIDCLSCDYGCSLGPASNNRCKPLDAAEASIAHQLVTLMDGEIGVQSVVGKGSTFWFEVAFDVAEPPEPKEPQPSNIRQKGEPRRIRRILLAEDYPTNQALLKIILETAGHELTIVENGQDAVNAAETRQFDLILMDLQMPMMDGHEATRCIRAGGSANADLPILALTASAEEDTVNECLEDGMDDVLTKPILRETLLTAVDKWLEMEPQSKSSHSGEVRYAAGDSKPSETTSDLPIDFNEALRSFAGNREILLRVLTQFRNNVDSEIRAIETAVDEDDWKSIHAFSHKIKGGAATVSAMPLSKAAREIETHAKKQCPEMLPQAAAKLRSEFEAFCAFAEREGILGYPLEA